MPLGGPPLHRDRNRHLAAWIDEGARATPTPRPPNPSGRPRSRWLGPRLPSSPLAQAGHAPLDRFVARYLATHGVAANPRSCPTPSSPAALGSTSPASSRSPAELRAFLADTRAGKRERLVETLLADNRKYAEHWISSGTTCCATTKA